MLREAQERLIQLLTDASARDMCAAVTNHVSIDADDEERAMVELYQAIPEAQLTRYAEGLIQKRWRAVRSVCPLTTARIPQFEELYTSWLAYHPAAAADESLSYGLTEALRALPFMRSQLRASDAPDYAADLLAFEILRRCSRMDQRPRFLRAAYRIDQLARSLQHGQNVEASLSPTQFRFEGQRLLWKPLPPHSYAPGSSL